MPNKLKTVLKRLEKLPASQTDIIYQFKSYKEDEDCSERNVVNLLVVLELYARHRDGKSLCDVTKDDVLAFLDPRKKSREEDPGEKWKSTWNSYRIRIAGFYRWTVNSDSDKEPSGWKTPDFVKTIKPKRTKRISSYSSSDAWQEHEIRCILKYCVSLRDKLVITLMRDTAACNHDITNLRLKHITLKKKHAIISTSYTTKTDKRMKVSAKMSYPYLHDYLNVHPFSSSPNAFLTLSEYTDKPILPDNLHNIMMRLKERVIGLLNDGKIAQEDVNTITELLRKPWNPYLVGRYSSIITNKCFSRLQ